MSVSCARAGTLTSPALKTELTGELRASRGELTGTPVQTTMTTFADSLVLAQTQTAERQDVPPARADRSLEEEPAPKSTIAETEPILAEAQGKAVRHAG